MYRFVKRTAASLVLALGIAFLTAGCGGDDPKSPQKSGDATLKPLPAPGSPGGGEAAPVKGGKGAKTKESGTPNSN